MNLGFSTMKLFHKLMLSFTLVLAMALGFFIFYLLPQYENVMLIEKKQGMKYSIEMIVNIIQDYHNRADRGEFSIEAAQKRALQRIETMKYQKGKNYFWVNDVNLKMLMHPAKPALNGTDVSNFADPDGTKLFVEMRKACQSSIDGEGFIFYKWAKVNETVPSDKVSYVKLYRDWGWIIGTGTWVGELDADLTRDIDSIYFYSYLFFGVLSFVVLGFGVGLSKIIVNPIVKATTMAKELAKGNLHIFE